MTITLDDVAGLEFQKNIFYESIILPIRKKSLFDKLILAPEKVVEQKTFLLYGPPGSGKTFLTTALANTLDVPFNYYSSTNFLNSYVGKGASDLRNIYSSASGLIFLDEIDAIGKDRSLFPNSHSDDILIELLNCLDGVGSNSDLITIAATNKFDILDSALKSRFAHKIPFFSLDYNQRNKLVSKYLSYYNNKLKSIDFIVDKTESWDARDIKNLFSKASRQAILSNRSYLSEKDFRGLI